MLQMILDTEAGQVSAEFGRRGISAYARVRVVVEISDTTELPMTEIVEAGKGLDWLTDEPDLYSDADLVKRTT